MPETPKRPEPATQEPGQEPGQVSDAVRGNWVDTLAPPRLRPYLRLSRADRPIGTWLLLLPCWWGVGLAALAGQDFGVFDLWIIAGSGLGAALMRGAGCTWNDISDRRIDAQVARTRSRPIPSGQVSVRQAFGWMAVQALISLMILLTFNLNAILLGVAALVPVAIYPFAKRFTWWPQVFLGLAFNWGALLAWTAHAGRLQWPAVILYLAGICWTLFYDTIYAYQDKEDDALIGVKSTARLFGDAARSWLRLFMMLAVFLMAAAVVAALVPGVVPGVVPGIVPGNMRGAGILGLVVALGGPWAFGWHMAWQLRLLDTDSPDTCLRLFRSNRNAGLLPTLFFAIALLV